MTTISFLCSGGAGPANYIIDNIRFNNGGFTSNEELGVIITNNKNSLIRDWCIENNLPCVVISSTSHPGITAFGTEEDKAIADTLTLYQTNLVILSGYRKKINKHVLSRFPDKILNVHPTLLPLHGGKGMYGMEPHQAVINSKDNWTGPTIHLVNEQYDSGHILAQHKIPVMQTDTAETIKQKVKNIEPKLYSDTIVNLLKTLK